MPRRFCVVASLLALGGVALLSKSPTELHGIYETIDADDEPIEFVYQSPADPRGVLLVLHGCSHSATDMWPPSPSCPTCIGLPIETTIVAHALARDWTVAAVSSKDRAHKCWSAQDVPRLDAVVEKLRRGKRRVAALGASSGGGAAARLASEDFPGLVGVVAQIMPAMGPNTLETPIRFVHMRRDARRASIIARQVAALKARGVDADEFIVEPAPLAADVFWDRPVPALSKPVADQLIDAFKRDGILDKNTNMILQDPRTSNWRHSAASVVPEDTDALVPDESPVSELMNVHWAFHEFTDAYLDDCLDWLDRLLE